LDVLKKYDVTALQGEGQITGFNGLILGLAKERSMDAMCILGEIDNPNMIQPKTAEAVLQVLIKILGISSMNMLELEEEERRKKFMEHQMSYLEKVMENGEPPGVA
jgi:proteasome assembly chaperone (PAC2) family protein